MSCTTIELKRKAVTELEEIGKKIQEDLSGDFVSSELAERISKTLTRMGFEVTDGEDSSVY